MVGACVFPAVACIWHHRRNNTLVSRLSMMDSCSTSVKNSTSMAVIWIWRTFYSLEGGRLLFLASSSSSLMIRPAFDGMVLDEISTHVDWRSLLVELRHCCVCNMLEAVGFLCSWFCFPVFPLNWCLQSGEVIVTDFDRWPLCYSGICSGAEEIGLRWFSEFRRKALVGGGMETAFCAWCVFRSSPSSHTCLQTCLFLLGGF